jgi:sirohydrochlorin cobaltochelatase
MAEPTSQPCLPAPQPLTITPRDQADLLALDARINALLPPEYQNRYEEVAPVSMGSAELKFDADGKVAWEEMWTSYCDLALAGGPPHRGTLLAPAAADEVRAEADAYQQVVAEIARGLWLVTRLPALPRIAPGWVGVVCHDANMASWLARAITAENVWAWHEQRTLYLPAGPQFRLGKEIKNVVTVLAKTCHYWTGHMPAEQRAAIDSGPFLEAGRPQEVAEANLTVVDEIERGLRQVTGLPTVSGRTFSWIGVQADSEKMAVWLMRAMIAENVLARREGNVVYLPVNPKSSDGNPSQTMVETMAKVRRLWEVHACVTAADR